MAQIVEEELEEKKEIDTAQERVENREQIGGGHMVTIAGGILIAYLVLTVIGWAVDKWGD